MTTFLILLAATGLNAAASFFLKVLGQESAALLSLATLANPYLYLAVGCFGLNIVGYALLLQRLPLATGYPVFVGVTFAFVLLLSLVFLRESLSWMQSAGIVLIFAGVFLATR